MRHIKLTVKHRDFTPFSEVYTDASEVNSIIMPSWMDRMFTEWLIYKDLQHFKLCVKVGDTTYFAKSNN